MKKKLPDYGWDLAKLWTQSSRRRMRSSWECMSSNRVWISSRSSRGRGWMRSSWGWMRSSRVWMISSPVWMRSSWIQMRSSRAWMRSCRAWMRSSRVWMRSSRLWMWSSRVVRASDCQCQSRNSHGFDPSIFQHNGILWAADEELLNKKDTYCTMSNMFPGIILVGF